MPAITTLSTLSLQPGDGRDVSSSQWPVVCNLTVTVSFSPRHRPGSLTRCCCALRAPVWSERVLSHLQSKTPTSRFTLNTEVLRAQTRECVHTFSRPCVAYWSQYFLLKRKKVVKCIKRDVWRLAQRGCQHKEESKNLLCFSRAITPKEPGNQVSRFLTYL